MMKRRRFLFLSTFLFALSALRHSPSADSSGFSGTVVDMATESPIRGAEVSVEGEVAVTDLRGRYELPMAPGVHEIRVRAPGYIGMTRGWCALEEGEWANFDFEMVPRDPDDEAAAIIDEKVMQTTQELPPDLMQALREEEVTLTTVEEVPETIRVLMPDDSVVEMEMDEYLKGVVPREMPASWPAEALRAQAVAARTYASTSHRHGDKGADVCTTTHCQVWGPTQYETTNRAVDATRGVAATYDGYLIRAFYFAHCDGETRASEDVWGGYLPYCRSVECTCGKEERFGHGVGMCQWGAQAMAEAGHTYKDIIKHYYTGVEVANGPKGSVSVPEWNRSTAVTFTFSNVIATAVQFSNDWVWEGEELYHHERTGRVVADSQALNGWAWFGEGGSDNPGGWYGPYTCDLAGSQNYDVYFRLKTSDNALDRGLATLDIVDQGGERHYNERKLRGTNFGRNGEYEEFRLELNYGSVSPTCNDPHIKDGLEFRTWFSSAGDLYLDRVTVFRRPQSVASDLVWNVREEEGTQEVIVRFLDKDGNTYDQVVEVNVDMSAPRWLSYGSRSAIVQDTLSGLDIESAAWSDSPDGETWSEWRTLSLAASPGTTEPVELKAPSAAGEHVRFRIRDMAGNASESQVVTNPPELIEIVDVWMVPLVLKGAGY